MAESYEIKIGQLMKNYVKNVQDKADTVSKEVAKETVAKLKKTSPKSKITRHKKGRYKDGWKAEQTLDHTWTVYNAKYPGLTHLLNNGHAIANGYGKGYTTKDGMTRINGDQHITKAEEWAVAEFQKRMEREL